MFRAVVAASFRGLEAEVDAEILIAGSVDSRVVSVDDLDADEDLLKSTGCDCCCT